MSRVIFRFALRASDCADAARVRVRAEAEGARGRGLTRLMAARSRPADWSRKRPASASGLALGSGCPKAPEADYSHTLKQAGHRDEPVTNDAELESVGRLSLSVSGEPSALINR